MSVDKLSLADQYTMLGLRLKNDGTIYCMFCRRYATALPGASGVKVVHRPDCYAALLLKAPEANDGE